MAVRRTIRQVTGKGSESKQARKARTRRDAFLSAGRDAKAETENLKLKAIQDQERKTQALKEQEAKKEAFLREKQLAKIQNEFNVDRTSAYYIAKNPRNLQVRGFINKAQRLRSGRATPREKIEYVRNLAREQALIGAQVLSNREIRAQSIINREQRRAVENLPQIVGNLAQQSVETSQSQAAARIERARDAKRPLIGRLGPTTTLANKSTRLDAINNKVQEIRKERTAAAQAAADFIQRGADKYKAYLGKSILTLPNRTVIQIGADLLKAAPALFDVNNRIKATEVFILTQAFQGKKDTVINFIKEQNKVSTKSAISATKEALLDPTTYILAGLSLLSVAKAGAFAKKPTVKTSKIPKIGSKSTPNVVWVNQKTGTIRFSDATGKVFKGAKVGKGTIKSATIRKVVDRIFKGKRLSPKGTFKPAIQPKIKVTKLDKAAKKLGFKDAAERSKWTKLTQDSKTSIVSRLKLKSLEKEILKRINTKGQPNIKAQRLLLKRTKAAIKDAQQIRIKTSPRRNLSKSIQGKEKAAKRTKKPKAVVISAKKPTINITKNTKLLEIPRTTTVSPKTIAEKLIKQGKDVVYVQTKDSNFSRIVNLRTGETVIFKFKPLKVKVSKGQQAIVKSWQVTTKKPKIIKAKPLKQKLQLSNQNFKVKTKVKKVRSTYSKLNQQFQALQRVKTIFGASRFIAVGVAFGRLNKFRAALLPMQKVNLDFNIKLIERISDVQIPKISPISLNKFGVAQIPAQIAKIKQSQSQATRLKTFGELKSVKRVSKKTKSPLRKAPKNILKLKLPILKELKIIKNNPYDIYIKVGAKLVKFNPKPLKGADVERVARYVVNNHLSRSYIIRPTKGSTLAVKSKINAPQAYFRKPKGKSTLNSKSRVERRKYALNTRSEVRSIALAKIRAQIFNKPKKKRKTIKRK